MGRNRLGDSEIIEGLMREMGFNPWHLSTRLKLRFLKVKHRRVLSQIESDLLAMGCNSPIYSSFEAILLERFSSGLILKLAACRLIDWRHQWGSNWAFHLILLDKVISEDWDEGLQKTIWTALTDGVGDQERMSLFESLKVELFGMGNFLGPGPIFE